MLDSQTCPCGSLKSLGDCCGPLLRGELVASGAEALMRSRYTAFALQKMDYLYRTLDPSTRHLFDQEANREWAQEAKFTKLEIIKSHEQGLEGFVSFKAHFEMKGQSHVHCEDSVFRCVDGVWYFVEGRAY